MLTLAHVGMYEDMEGYKHMNTGLRVSRIRGSLLGRPLQKQLQRRGGMPAFRSALRTLRLGLSNRCSTAAPMSKFSAPCARQAAGVGFSRELVLRFPEYVFSSQY